MKAKEQPLREIVTVAEMARMVGLSRARFYQLVDAKVFPAPARNPKTKRPFYDRVKQERCLDIRKTNCGDNGKAILFYGKTIERPKRAPVNRRKRSQRRANQSAQKPSGVKSDPVISELLHGLGQLGLTGLTESKVRQAVATAHPDGTDGVESATLLMSVFHELKRQDSPDNLAR